MTQGRKIIYLIILLFVSLHSYALIVHDPKATITAIKHHAGQVKHWKEEISYFKQTVKNATEQNNMLKEQLMGLTKIRDIGDLEGQLSSLSSEIEGLRKTEICLMICLNHQIHRSVQKRTVY